eukprot:100039-Prorocentrum_minimum.AAC.1
MSCVTHACDCDRMTVTGRLWLGAHCAGGVHAERVDPVVQHVRAHGLRAGQLALDARRPECVQVVKRARCVRPDLPAQPPAPPGATR